MDFGTRAEASVLDMKEAAALAAENNIYLVELGGTGEGIIGALAAVTLRAAGNSGRVIELEGIRSIKGLVSAGELLQKTSIDSVQNEEGNRLDNYEMIDSMDWVRPSLLGGRPVLMVSPRDDDSGGIVWFSQEAKKRKERKEGKTANEHC
jgi:hypothetical protein